MNSLGGQQPSHPSVDGTESDGTPGTIQDIRKHFNLLRNELRETVQSGSHETVCITSYCSDHELHKVAYSYNFKGHLMPLRMLSNFLQFGKLY